MKLGSCGVSVIFSTGVGQDDCLILVSSGDVGVKFLPLFPAFCAYGFFFWKEVQTSIYKLLSTPPLFRRSAGHYRRRDDK